MGKQLDKTESSLPEFLRMPSAESRFHLAWNVEGLERIFPLREGENRVGALSSNDLVLLDVGVSRRQALGSEVRVTDLGSKNGTLVNGTSVDSADLAAGDEIVLGNVVLSLRAQYPGTSRTAGRHHRPGRAFHPGKRCRKRTLRPRCHATNHRGTHGLRLARQRARACPRSPASRLLVS